VCALFTYGLSAINARASTIISLVAATASSEFGSANTYDIGNTSDQSGLSAAFVSG